MGSWIPFLFGRMDGWTAGWKEAWLEVVEYFCCHYLMMADVDRKARIAAARKKLKQIQKSNQVTSPNSNITSDDTNKNLDIDSSSKAEEPMLKGSRTNSLDILNSSTAIETSYDCGQSSVITNVTTTSTVKLDNSHSKQVAGPMSESITYLNGDINNVDELEKQNQELTDKLEKLKQQNDKLQNSLESERRTFEEKLKKDLGALKEQLQVHIQTVGILVAEKTELQFACNQATKLAETRQSEVEELAGRLKASRQRVTDLEKNLSVSNSSNQKLEKSNKELTKDLDKLKMEIYKNNKSREELQQHNLELQGRLQQKMHEISKLEDITIDLKGKLEMSELYLEQLKNGHDRPDSNVAKQIEKILTEKTELQTKLQQQEDAVKLINRERESMITQYNQYIDQLKQHDKDLQHQVDKLTREREADSSKIEDLESTLNQLKSIQAEVTDDRIQEHEEKARLMETVENLMSQLMAASKNLEVQMADNSQLSRLVIEKEQMILELEQEVDKMSSSTVDQDKLLETMQSDKTALSRAMAQNKELKTQFLELQEQFVKMSQKNMDAMTKLQGEEHNSRELLQKFCMQEDELKQLRHLLDEKSGMLEELKRVKSDMIVNGITSSSSENEDKTEENKKLAELFQRKVPLIENLQKELSSAQDTINALTNQNSELRAKIDLLKKFSLPANGLESTDVTEKPTANVDILKTTITQLEMEKHQVSEQLKESLKIQNILKEKVEIIQQDLARQVPATLNGDVVTKVHFEALQHAMQQLEEKYTRTMRDKAELVDRIERLEHIILQLQGETDTIGEYVSLYHQQRYLMKQRTAEKDNHILRLASERSELQGKFRQLQALVVQLLREKNSQYDESDLTVALGSTPSDPELDQTQPVQPDKKGENFVPGEDWPDYSESSDEEARVKRVPRASSVDNTIPDQSHSSPSLGSKISPLKTSIPPCESTVLKIMHLLSEIDSSTRDELLKIPFFCQNCVGDILVV